VPYALESDGEVIKYFDPLYHVPLEARSTRMDERDNRWVLCKRPFVTAGGELTLSSLDMTYLDSGRFHEAPLQIKANCGVFLMDDFGRQQVAPHALLNRWIVPLEKDVDYLSLNSGQTLEVPFDVLLVFSTNLKPEDLVDEAFLRRIRYKIHVPDPTPDEFEAIFKRVCTANGITYEPTAFNRLTAFYETTALTPRACHPRDIVNQINDIARFYRVQPKLSDQLLDLAIKSYFVRARL
jgi:predicted ATPase with chaperone activity